MRTSSQDRATTIGTLTTPTRNTTMTRPAKKAIWSMIWKPLMAGAAILAVGLGAGGYFWQWRKPRTELQLPGTVETQEVRLSSRVGGRVTKVLVDEGSQIAAGTPLLELEMPELDAQRAQLEAQLAAAKAESAKAIAGPRVEDKAAAKANVAAAEARVARMRKGYRAEEKLQAREELTAIEADVENARLELDRERALREKGAGKEIEYDAAVARYGRLQAQAAAAAAKSKMMEAGYRPEEVAEAEAELASIQANFDLLEAGTRQEDKDTAAAKVAQLEAQLAEIDVKRGERTVTAPEAATVEVIGVRPGDIAAPNQPLIRILRADDLWVKAFISEVDLGHIRLGLPVEVTIDTFPGKRFKGEVMYIASESEFTPRNVQTIDERRHQVFGFKVRVDDPQGVFKSGMAAEVWLPKSK